MFTCNASGNSPRHFLVVIWLRVGTLSGPEFTCRNKMYPLLGMPQCAQLLHRTDFFFCPTIITEIFEQDFNKVGLVNWSYMGLEKKGRWSRTPENQSFNASMSGIERQVDSEHYFHYSHSYLPRHLIL